MGKKSLIETEATKTLLGKKLSNRDIRDKPETGAEGNGNTKPLSNALENAVKKEQSKQVLQLKKWFFTFNNYTIENIETLETTFKKVAKEYIFQEEKGESGTIHLQGYLELKKKMRPSEFRLPKQIHWEPARNIEACREYCCKEDSRNGQIFIWPIPPGKPKILEKMSKLLPWQETIYNKIKQEPDDRCVNWIFDIIGNNGKTQFCKWLDLQSQCICITGGGVKDIACNIALRKKEGMDLNNNTTVLFNFQKSSENISYNAIESVKDGFITSSKYESSTLNFNCPHVVIFSNDLPDLNKLSEDRWCIYYIEQNTKILKKMNLKNVTEIQNFIYSNKNLDNDKINSWVLNYLNSKCSQNLSFFEKFEKRLKSENIPIPINSEISEISEYSMDWVSKEEGEYSELEYMSE